MRRQRLVGFIVGTALSGALCLPLAAQVDTPPNGASQVSPTPAATNSDAAAGQNAATQPAADQPGANPITGNGAAASDTREQQPLGPPPKEGFWGRVNPFARKKYVNKQLTPIRDRVNELDGLTDKNAQSINDLDSRSQAAIAQARNQADQAGQTASAAQQAVKQDADQANQLNQRYDATDHTIQSVDQYQVAQTAELHFNRGAASLDTNAQQQLDGFLQGLDTQKGYVVEVTAYSTLRGQAALDNSQRLADTVVRYLVLQHNVPLYRIYTMGMGNASAPDAGTASPTGEDESHTMTPAAEPSTGVARSTQGGTVEIKILRNSLNNAQPQAGGQQ